MLDDNWFVMGGLLDESRFFPLEASDSYETGLGKMVAALTEQGQLDEGFAERLREREKLGSMAFDHDIAIPHVVQYAGGVWYWQSARFRKPFLTAGRTSG